MTAALRFLRGRWTAFIGLPTPFTWFLGGLAISRLGDALYTFALPWIAYELTHSAVIMSSLYATGVLPVVIFGPLVGVYLDRWDRRRMMMAADAIRAALVALVPLLHLLGWLQLWHLYVVSFALAGLTMAFDVATTAATPQMVGQNLTTANAATRSINQLGDMLGPVAAGLLIVALGGFHVLWLDALSFSATFLALLRMPTLQRTAAALAPASVLRDMQDGLRWLVRSRVNLTLSVQAAIGNFGYSAVAAVLMFYLRSTLHLDATQSGLNYTILGAGGLLGSLAIVPLERRFRRGRLFPALLMCGTLGFLLAAGVRLSPAPGIGLALVGACNVAWTILATSVRQETVPPELLGRVLSFSRVLTRLAMPLGAFLGGLLTQRFDPVAVFLLAAAAKAVEVVIARWSAMARL